MDSVSEALISKSYLPKIESTKILKITSQLIIVSFKAHGSNKQIDASFCVSVLLSTIKLRQNVIKVVVDPVGGKKKERKGTLSF